MYHKYIYIYREREREKHVNHVCNYVSTYTCVCIARSPTRRPASPYRPRPAPPTGTWFGHLFTPRSHKPRSFESEF